MAARGLGNLGGDSRRPQRRAEQVGEEGREEVASTTTPASLAGSDASEAAAPVPKGESAAALYQALTGVDLSRCPHCDAFLESRPLRPADGHAAALMCAQARRRRAQESVP